MSKRSANMKRFNAVRSAKVNAMIQMLDVFDRGFTCDFDELAGSYPLIKSHHMMGEINSYRAKKIAELLNMNISKSKLVQFSKPKDYEYELTCSEIMSHFNEFIDELINYYEWFKQPAVRKANLHDYT